jgi:hypothetical protein
LYVYRKEGEAGRQGGVKKVVSWWWGKVKVQKGIDRLYTQ